MIYFVACSLIWGLTWIAIQYQFHAIDPNTAVFYRFIAASLILFGYAKLKKLPLKFGKEEHISFAIQGFFMFCLNYLLTYWASHLAPSALVALAFTSLIFFNMFGGHFFLKLAIEKKVFIGAFISFIGMIFISMNEISNYNLHPTSLIGFFLSLIATVSASAGNLVSLKNRQKKIPITTNNAWGMLYGSLLTLIFCILSGKSFIIQSFDRSFLLSFFYLTIFGTIISFGCYLKLIELFGPSKAAFTSVISPVIAVGISLLFESLPLTGFLISGVLFCVAGNIVALMPDYLLKLKKYAN